MLEERILGFSISVVHARVDTEHRRLNEQQQLVEQAVDRLELSVREGVITENEPGKCNDNCGVWSHPNVNVVMMMMLDWQRVEHDERLKDQLVSCNSEIMI